MRPRPSDWWRSIRPGRRAARSRSARPRGEVRTGPGCRKAVVSATPEAAGFYANAGYDEENWDETSVGGIVQMLKNLD